MNLKSRMEWGEPGAGEGFDALLADMSRQLGHVLERKERPEEALVEFEEAVRLEPQEAVNWFNLGDTLLALGRHREAREALRRSIDLDRTNWLAYYDYALVLYHLGDFETAAGVFREMVRRDPELKRAVLNPGLSALTNLALCIGEMGYWRQAAETLKPALKQSVSILYNLGRFHLRDKDYAEALKYLSMAGDLEPDGEDALHGAAVALMNLGRFEEAETFFKRALEADPSCADAWYDRGVNVARRKDPRRRPLARKHFLRVLDLKPDHAWAHYDLACLDALSGKLGAAFQRLERALAAGFKDRDHLLADLDLKPLRKDPRWKDLVTRLGA
jgi:tetratricopeptide (TPR) repeat protein